MRSLLVGPNPLSEAIQAHSMASLPSCVGGSAAGATQQIDATIMPAYPTYAGSSVQQAVKASLNTASVGELWRAFWNVMCYDNNPAIPPPYTTSVSGGYQGIYGNVIRDPRNKVTAAGANGISLNNSNMLLLRSALAAANIPNLRDGMSNNNGSYTNTVGFDYYLHGAGGTNPGGTRQFHITLNAANLGTVEPFLSTV